MFTEDLTLFFDTDGFGVSATLEGVEVVGVLDPGFGSADLTGFGAAAGTSPSFTLPSASVPAGIEGGRLVVADGPGAGTYRVANQRHDGTGVCTLDLLTQ